MSEAFRKYRSAMHELSINHSKQSSCNAKLHLLATSFDFIYLYNYMTLRKTFLNKWVRFPRSQLWFTFYSDRYILAINLWLINICKSFLEHFLKCFLSIKTHDFSSSTAILPRKGDFEIWIVEFLFYDEYVQVQTSKALLLIGVVVFINHSM